MVVKNKFKQINTYNIMCVYIYIRKIYGFKISKAIYLT